MEAVVVCLILGFVGLTIGLGIRRQQQWNEAVAAFATGHNLGLEAGGIFSSATANGQIDGLDTHIDTYTVKSGKSRTTYSRIRMNLGLDYDLNFTEESFGTAVFRFLGSDDIQLGMEEVDARLHLEGPESLVLALLDHHGRAALQDALNSGLKVTSGEVVKTEHGMWKTKEEIEEVMEKVRTLAQALSGRHTSVVVGLHSNALNDPDPRFRQRCFERLIESFRNSPLTAEVSEVFLESEEVPLRVQAARHLGHEAVDVLLEIVRDVGVIPSERALALRAIGTVLFKSTRVDDILIELSKSADLTEPDLGHLILEMAGRRKVGLPFDALPRYSDTLDHEGESSLSPDHRTALARALEFSDDDRVEGELLALLEDSDDSVAAVVAQALGTVSGVSVVPALMARSDGFFESGDLKRSARTAIDQIQGRVGHGVQHAVSLPEVGEDTGLSLAEVEEES